MTLPNEQSPSNKKDAPQTVGQQLLKQNYILELQNAPKTTGRPARLYRQTGEAAAAAALRHTATPFRFFHRPGEK